MHGNMHFYIVFSLINRKVEVNGFCVDYMFLPTVLELNNLYFYIYSFILSRFVMKCIQDIRSSEYNIHNFDSKIILI